MCYVNRICSRVDGLSSIRRIGGGGGFQPGLNEMWIVNRVTKWKAEKIHAEGEIEKSLRHVGGGLPQCLRFNL